MTDKIGTFIKYRNYLCSILGTILLIVGLSLTIYDYTLEQKAINTEATVLSINYTGSKPIAEIEYKAERQKITNKININDTKIAVNEKIEIKYDKNNPNIIIENSNILIIAVIIIVLSIILCILFLPTTIKEIIKNNNVTKLKKDNYFINAPITEVYINNTIKPIFNKYPYKIRSKFINSTDNKEYVFESDNTYINIQDLINKYGNKTVKIYLDKTDSSNYHIDITSLFPDIKLISPEDLMNPKPQQQPVEAQPSVEEQSSNESEDNKNEE